MFKKFLFYILVCFAFLAVNTVFQVIPLWAALAPLLAPFAFLGLVLGLIALVVVGAIGATMLVSALIMYAEWRNKPKVNEKLSQTTSVQKC